MLDKATFRNTLSNFLPLCNYDTTRVHFNYDRVPQKS